MNNPTILVIQGTADADATGKLSQSEVSKTVEFCFKAFTHISPKQKDVLIQKLKRLGIDAEADDEATLKAINEMDKDLTPEESQVLDILRSRRMIREDGFNMDSFTLDSIDGLGPNMERGKLGLVRADTAKLNKSQLYSTSFLEGKRPGIRAQKEDEGVNGATGGLANGQPSSMEPTNEHEQNTARGPWADESGGTKNTPRDGSTNSKDTALADKAETAMGAPQALPNGNSNGLGDRLLEPLEVHGALLDEASRHAVMSALHEAAENLETPFDMLMRLANSVKLPSIRLTRLLLHSLGKYNYTR